MVTTNRPMTIQSITRWYRVPLDQKSMSVIRMPLNAW